MTTVHRASLHPNYCWYSMLLSMQRLAWVAGYIQRWFSCLPVVGKSKSWF